MVGIRRIVIDIELSVITILDRIGYDFRCRVIMGTMRLVLSTTTPERERPFMSVILTAGGLVLALRWFICCVLLEVGIVFYFIVHLLIGHVMVQEVLQKQEELLPKTSVRTQ